MRTLVIILVFFLVIPVFGEMKTYELPELGRPAIFIVTEGKMFVLEKASIYIYSLEDFRLIKKFGREGEGPKEFITRQFGPPMSMSLVNNQLAINSMNKISFWTQEGEFVRVIKSIPNLVFYPIKENFMAIGPSDIVDNRAFVSFSLVDSSYNKIKTLLKTDVDVDFQNINLPHGALTYRPVYKDKIYICPQEDQFLIDVYTAQGKMAYQIKKKVDPVKIPEKFKKDTIHWFKTDPVYKNFYPRIKDNIRLKKNFPVIRDLHIADDTLCTVTYKRKNKLWECIVMDLNGKEKKRLYIPLSRYIPFTYYPLLYSVYQGKLYTLVEDEDEEVLKINVITL